MQWSLPLYGHKGHEYSSVHVLDEFDVDLFFKPEYRLP